MPFNPGNKRAQRARNVPTVGGPMKFGLYPTVGVSLPFLLKLERCCGAKNGCPGGEAPLACGASVQVCAACGVPQRCPDNAPRGSCVSRADIKAALEPDYTAYCADCCGEDLVSIYENALACVLSLDANDDTIVDIIADNLDTTLAMTSAVGQFQIVKADLNPFVVTAVPAAGAANAGKLMFDVAAALDTLIDNYNTAVAAAAAGGAGTVAACEVAEKALRDSLNGGLLDVKADGSTDLDLLLSLQNAIVTLKKHNADCTDAKITAHRTAVDNLADNVDANGDALVPPAPMDLRKKAAAIGANRKGSLRAKANAYTDGGVAAGDVAKVDAKILEDVSIASLRAAVNKIQKAVKDVVA